MHTHTGEFTDIKPTKVMLFDGILSLYEKDLREIFDLKLFVDVPDDVRILRRIKRDIQGRGRTMDSVIHQYLETVRHMHALYIEPSKWDADFVIGWGRMNPNTIQFLATMIQTTISK